MFQGYVGKVFEDVQGPSQRSFFFPSQTNLGINGTRWESHVFTAIFVGSDLGDLPRDLLSKVLMPGICNWTWRVKAGSSKMGWT